MRGLLSALAAILTWACVATVMSLLTVTTYAWREGYLEGGKLDKVAAVMHGVDMVPRREAERLASEKVTSQKPSLEAVELRRAALTSDLEMRENMVRDMLAEFKKLQRALEDEKDRFGQVVTAFQARLEQEKTRAVAEGRRQFQSIVESMKPKQAKEQLLLKYKENKIDVVVETMRTMDEAKRAKVLAEFKAAEDQEILAKILENIRSPGVAAISEAQDALKAPTQGQ